MMSKPNESEPYGGRFRDFYVFRNAVYQPDKVEAIALLAENPNLLEMRSTTGETVLHYVAVENEQEIIAWLLLQGANINTVNDFGETPLMNATALGYADLCRFLVLNGAKVRFVSVGGESALSKAVQENNVSLVQFFLAQLSPDEDINPYFDDMDAYYVLKHGGAVATILQEHGLTQRYD